MDIYVSSAHMHKEQSRSVPVDLDEKASDDSSRDDARSDPINRLIENLGSPACMHLSLWASYQRHVSAFSYHLATLIP